MGGRFDIRCYDGYEKKVSISKKQAPAVRKVYRTCEQQKDQAPAVRKVYRTYAFNSLTRYTFRPSGAYFGHINVFYIPFVPLGLGILQRPSS